MREAAEKNEGVTCSGMGTRDTSVARARKPSLASSDHTSASMFINRHTHTAESCLRRSRHTPEECQRQRKRARALAWGGRTRGHYAGARRGSERRHGFVPGVRRERIAATSGERKSAAKVLKGYFGSQEP